MTEKIQIDERAVSAEGTPTQVANPKRATLRTVLAILAGLVLALPLVNSMLVILQEELHKVTAFDIPGWVYVAINLAVGGVALVGGLVTRWMAAARANEWIKRHLPGLAAIPLEPADK